MTDKNPSSSSIRFDNEYISEQIKKMRDKSIEELLLKFDYLEKRIIELENTLMEFMAPFNHGKSDHYRIYCQLREMVDGLGFELDFSRDAVTSLSVKTIELVARITELEEKSK